MATGQTLTLYYANNYCDKPETFVQAMFLCTTIVVSVWYMELFFIHHTLFLIS